MCRLAGVTKTTTNRRCQEPRQERQKQGVRITQWRHRIFSSLSLTGPRSFVRYRISRRSWNVRLTIGHLSGNSPKTLALHHHSRVQADDMSPDHTKTTLLLCATCNKIKLRLPHITWQTEFNQQNVISRIMAFMHVPWSEDRQIIMGITSIRSRSMSPFPYHNL